MVLKKRKEFGTNMNYGNTNFQMKNAVLRILLDVENLLK